MCRFIVVILTLSTACAVSVAAPPNVLIIYADEYRIDCMGAMGNTEIRTPHLDALAGDGVLYRNSFCTWPVCTPSRISLLTGQYVQQHRGSSNRSTVPPGTPTFASMLRDAGYLTKAVGKMHITPAYQDIGFQEMILAEQNGGGRYVDDYHRYLKDRGLINALDLIDQEREFRTQAPDSYWENFGARVSDLPDEHHITTWVGDRAVEDLEDWGADSAHLLMVGFLKPHHPFDPPAPWHEMYDPETITPLPGWTDRVPDVDRQRGRGYFDNETLTDASLRRVTAYYYATISHMDHHIGRMIESLKESGVYDDTLIIFTADHGEYMGFHHRILKGNHMYDPLVKVPLIIKYPKQRYKGMQSDELVNSLDVTATILSAAGLTGTEEMRGAPLGVVSPGRARVRDVVITQSGGGRVMARTQRHKLILAQRNNNSLFFDLQSDPFELTNEFNNPRYSDEVAALKSSILNWFMTESGRMRYVDEAAPLISGSNVPEDLDEAARAMEAYFVEGVKRFLELQE